MSETIEDVVKSLRDRAEARRKSGKLLQIDDRMFDLIADRIEAAMKHQFRETTKTIPEEVVVAKMETTTPTCEKSSQVGNAAALREALKYMRDASREFCSLILNSKHNEIFDKYKHAEVSKIRAAITNANVALAAPPRNCDVMSLDTAKKVWFAKEIVPRLNGDLPLGKEVPFEEWFVSQHEKGETNEQ